MTSPTNTPTDAAPRPRRRRRPWLTALKWIVGIVLGLTVLLFLAVGVAVWILTPPRLTPLVNKYASQMIDGSVDARRVELTYWSTFPRLQLDVDTLTVTSRSLAGLPDSVRRQLPPGADTLLRVDGFSGEVNLLELLRGRIALSDIIIRRPDVNLVDAGPGRANYNIFPPSEEPETEQPLVVPDISFSRFVIEGDAPLRYFSLPDTTAVNLTLRTSGLDGSGAPVYRLDLGAGASTRFGDISLDSLRLGMQGDIVWRHSAPYRVELKEFEASVNNLRAVTDATVNFADTLTVERLDLRLPAIKVADVIALVPPAMRGELGKVSTNLSFTLGARLKAPYRPASDRLPSMTVDLEVPEGKLDYEQLQLHAVAIEASADIDGDNPDASVVTVKRLMAIGKGVGFGVNGTVRSLFSDPAVKGTFKGGIEFDRLPRALTTANGVNVSGSLRADATFNLRLSWLTRENFHRINATGDASLSNLRFNMAEMGVNCFVRRADMKLGTTRSFVRGENGVDSLLTLSLKIDTLSALLPGMEAELRSLRAGVGARNTASSIDTTVLNPFGGAFAIERFKFLSTADSTRFRLRALKARASVKRFRNSATKPLMHLAVNADRLRYSDRLNRASLRESALDLTVHPSMPRIGRRTRARMDSLSALHPELSRDSIYKLARASRPRRPRRDTTASTPPTEKIDYGLDAETTSLMRRWRASGTLTAKRGRVFIPYFPLRNRLTDVSLKFNNDSIVVSHTRYRVGRSDFLIDGTVTNLTRAVTSRSGRQALQVNFRVTSDTIDVNQIAAAVFAGAAFAEKERRGAMIAIADSDDDNVIEQSIVQNADSTDAGPLLIPTNIEATLRLNARNVIYSDFLFNNLRGSVEVFDGSLNMRNLSARTDVGAVDLTALYEGLTPADLNFAFGMQVRDFRVGRFLDLVPSLDTIMPLLSDMDGVINGEIAAHARLDSVMDIVVPSLNAAVTLSGDSLVLLDAATYRKIGKWMLFKHKERNVIDSMTVRLVVQNSMMQLYPFVFNIDRYRLGVYGNNDMDLKLKYHIAVLKSPIPFKFGINVSGTPEKLKIRLGGAKWDEKSAMRTFAISDTVRVNLVKQIQSLFRRGLDRAGAQGGGMRLDATPAYRPGTGADAVAGADTISHADSLIFIREGLIPAPPAPAPAESPEAGAKRKKTKSRK